MAAAEPVGGAGGAGARPQVWRHVHPTAVGDVVALRHALPGRLRLTLRRNDRAAGQAVVTALRLAGATLDDDGGRERHGAGRPPRSLIARYDPARVSPARLLAAPLPPLPLPRARVDASATATVPAERLWATLTTGDGPPWEPPAMLRVQPVDGPDPRWDITVAVGAVRLPHVMRVAAEHAPRLLELVIAGRLSAVVRLDVEPLPAGSAPGGTAGSSRIRARQWFEFTGSALEAAIAEAIVERLTRRFAVEHLSRLCAAAERW
jgi:hypothetical protein